MKRGLMLVLMGLVGLAGCGRHWKPDFSTPEAAWRTFDRAMREGNLDLAADCYAYGAIAKRKNPSWDHFPPMERAQIVKKMRQTIRRALQTSTYSLPETFQVSVQGDEARVSLPNGPTVVLVRTDNGWKIVNGYPLPFPF